MTDSGELKLQEVAVARYEYRHDAEFAAGFLDDAGIPYRLQLDDPAMGISIGVSATIWVRGLDVERAREVLEVEHRPVSLTRRTPSARQREAERARAVRSRAPTRPRPAAPSPKSELSARERAIALLLSAAALGAGQVMTGGDFGDPVGYVSAGAAAILAVVAAVGRAPETVRRLLSALSGNAP